MKTSGILPIIILLIAWSEIAFGGQTPGRVIGWGTGGGEALEVASPTDAMQYITVGGKELTNVVAIAARGLHAMALKSDGTLVAWGFDPGKRLVTIPSDLGNVTAISLADGHNLALRRDGTVVSWGYDTNSAWYDPAAVMPAGISNVVAISGGGLDSVVIKRDGAIERWGGPYGAPPIGLSNIVAVAQCNSKFGDDLVLRKDETIVEWPSYYVPDDDPYTMPPGLTNVVAIASGNAHALALKKDGTVAAWGFPEFDYMNPNYGQLNVPAGLSNVVAIAGGPSISLALKRDGTVVVWGDNHHHQVDLAKGLSNIVAIAAGQDFCLAIQAPGPITNTPPSLPTLQR